MNMQFPAKVVQTKLGGFQPVSQNTLTKGANTASVVNNLEIFISQLVGLLTVIAGIFFIVNMMMAAVSWITAGGDSGKISKARDAMIQNTIGLIIVVGSYGIIGLIALVVGIDILNPAAVLKTLIP